MKTCIVIAIVISAWIVYGVIRARIFMILFEKKLKKEREKWQRTPHDDSLNFRQYFGTYNVWDQEDEQWAGKN